MKRNANIWAEHITRRSLSTIVAVVLLCASIIALIASPRTSAAACTSPPADYGRATMTLNVPSSTTYRIWSRMLIPDSTNNSYLLEIDGSTCFTIGDGGMPANTWTWADHQSGGAKAQVALGAGNHTIKMIGREPNVKLGRILFLSDPNCVPSGNGDNCTVSPKDSEAPSVAITAPAAGSTVKGILNVLASAKDNVGVSKVEFYVNGSLKAADSGAPYEYTWDSRVTANGKVNLMVRAYDGVGNVNSDSLVVTVAGGDSQAPSAPGNITAQIDAANKITLKWSPSTDNIAVAGYRVVRNKVTIGQTASGTEYVDVPVLPSTTYTYQVYAYDAAGNASGLSNEITVKTPFQADSEAPSMPTDLLAKTVSTHQINLAWSPSTDNIAVAGYDIFRSSGKAPAVKIATVSSASYGDTSLVPKTQYSYYVVARDKADNLSNKSVPVSGDTLAQPTTEGYGAVRGKVSFNKRLNVRAWSVTHINGVKHIFDTDQNGNYMIDSLPPGTYKISYHAKGAQKQEFTLKVVAGKGTSQNVNLEKQ